MKPLPWLCACALAGNMAGGPPAYGAQPAASSNAAAPAARPAAAGAASAPSAATVASAAAAERSSAPTSLAAALDAAWQRAIASREADGQQRRAEAERSTAASLWAAPPALALSHRNDRWQSNAGKRESEIGVAVPLWLPGQRAARGAAAEAAAAQADAARQAARLRLAGEVREAAWGLVALQAEVGQAEAQVRSLAQLAADVERRVRAGDLARADALAAVAEHLAAAAEQTGARQRLQAAQARWRTLTGLAAAPPLEALGADAAPTDVAGALPPAHPELRLAGHASEHARKQLELLRSSRRDAPELTLGLRHDVPGGPEPAHNSVVVSLRLPFGSDERYRPLEAVALSELDIAQTHEQRQRERLEAELASARGALQSAQAQADAGRERARLLRERAALIERSFRAGETPLPELLRALAAAAQADGAAAQQQAALGLAGARLQQALGLLP
ncbi:MAG: TolC family protein [Burkholderiales bacterium]|nr:TolC family protein [Burkholderiales bacterium]